jgi:hypothetical protein
MSVKLEFGASNTPLSSTPTASGEVYVMIIAVTDSTVTYTEKYEDNTTETFTDEALSAGQVLYGVFSTVSASDGHAKVAR